MSAEATSNQRETSEDAEAAPSVFSGRRGAGAASVFAGRQWQQVLERDARADGQFFYAVRSTRIYCRPSCPSRRPARKNVSFFATSAAAEAAGFRACRRCEPERAEPREDPQATAIRAAAEYLTEHAGERTRLSDLAKATGVGRLAVLRGFRRVLGVSPGEFARAQRVARFKEALRPPDVADGGGGGGGAGNGAAKDAGRGAGATTKKRAAKRITDAIYEAGFGSSSRLYEGSGEALGMTPRTMREGGAGSLIRYATAASPLGRMLVAATATGVCAIAFGRDDAELVSDLRGRFNRAQLVAAKGNSGWLAEAVAFVASQMTEHPLAATFPLDVRATAFQQRVWRALKAIPRGETRSYSDVAREIGRPTAARAVAAACAANPVALAVPCHRVVGRDGSVTGYRWGVERKRKLLVAEGAGARVTARGI